MSVKIEFFGIPRERAGVSVTTIEAANLSEAIRGLESLFPQLAEACFDGGELRPGFVANLNGDRFVSDPATRLAPGDSILILSADAGG